jgi:hypothetical protein
MATSERVLEHNGGLMPSVNSLAAAGILFLTYVARFGVIYEDIEPDLLYLPLYLTTDLILPVLAAAWLLGVPTAMLVEKIR